MADQNPFDERKSAPVKSQAEIDGEDNPFYSGGTQSQPSTSKAKSTSPKAPSPVLKEVRNPSPPPAEMTPEVTEDATELTCPADASPEVKKMFDTLRKREKALMKWEAELKVWFS